MIRNTKSSWGSVARWLHWGLGLAIVAMLAYGWWMNHIPVRADRFFHRSLHANIGYAILVLMAVRLIGARSTRCRQAPRARRAGSASLA